MLNRVRSRERILEFSTTVQWSHLQCLLKDAEETIDNFNSVFETRRNARNESRKGS